MKAHIGLNERFEVGAMGRQRRLLHLVERLFERRDIVEHLRGPQPVRPPPAR